METFITIFISTLIVGVITFYFNKKLEAVKVKNTMDIQKIEMDFNEKVEELKMNNAREMQIESFFRNVSGEELKKTFDEWTDTLFDLQVLAQEGGAEKFLNMIRSIYVYGSDETVQKAVKMQQFSFSNKVEENKNRYVYMVMIADVIASLKKDFTGYQVDPLDILKLRLKDYQKSRDMFLAASEDIKKLQY